jgi:hypothetical protein
MPGGKAEHQEHFDQNIWRLDRDSSKHTPIMLPLREPFQPCCWGRLWYAPCFTTGGYSSLMICIWSRPVRIWASINTRLLSQTSCSKHTKRWRVPALGFPSTIRSLFITNITRCIEKFCIGSAKVTSQRGFCHAVKIIRKKNHTTEKLNKLIIFNTIRIATEFFMVLYLPVSQHVSAPTGHHHENTIYHFIITHLRARHRYHLMMARRGRNILWYREI